MRRDNEPGLTRFESRQLVEVGHLVCATTKVQQQYVFATNRALDAWDQRDASLRRVRAVRTEIELTIVKRDRKCVIPEHGGAIDQLLGRMRNRIQRIVGRVRVQFDLEHAIRLDKNPAGSSGP